jgi:hypothetical protein
MLKHEFSALASPFSQLSHTIGMMHAGIGTDMQPNGYGGWRPRVEYGGGWEKE